MFTCGCKGSIILHILTHSQHSWHFLRRDPNQGPIRKLKNFHQNTRKPVFRSSGKKKTAEWRPKRMENQKSEHRKWHQFEPKATIICFVQKFLESNPLLSRTNRTNRIEALIFVPKLHKAALIRRSFCWKSIPLA